MLSSCLLSYFTPSPSIGLILFSVFLHCIFHSPPIKWTLTFRIHAHTHDPCIQFQPAYIRVRCAHCKRTHRTCTVLRLVVGCFFFLVGFGSASHLLYTMEEKSQSHIGGFFESLFFDNRGLYLQCFELPLFLRTKQAFRFLPSHRAVAFYDRIWQRVEIDAARCFFFISHRNKW